jgi:hypothetical protein
MYFSSVLVPELYFANPDGFLELLESGGDRYLGFLWERAGEVEGIEEPMDSEGLSVEVGTLDPDHRFGLVKLPGTEFPGECQFLGLLLRKSKITLKGIQPGASRVFTLDRGSGIAPGDRSWMIGEILQTGEHVEYEEPVASPDTAQFISIIREILKNDELLR